jgi:hypothetical protein
MPTNKYESLHIHTSINPCYNGTVSIYLLNKSVFFLTCLLNKSVFFLTCPEADLGFWVVDLFWGIGSLLISGLK